MSKLLRKQVRALVRACWYWRLSALPQPLVPGYSGSDPDWDHESEALHKDALGELEGLDSQQVLGSLGAFDRVGQRLRGVARDELNKLAGGNQHLRVHSFGVGCHRQVGVII